MHAGTTPALTVHQHIHQHCLLHASISSLASCTGTTGTSTHHTTTGLVHRSRLKGGKDPQLRLDPPLPLLPHKIKLVKVPIKILWHTLRKSPGHRYLSGCASRLPLKDTPSRMNVSGTARALDSIHRVSLR